MPLPSKIIYFSIFYFLFSIFLLRVPSVYVQASQSDLASTTLNNSSDTSDGQVLGLIDIIGDILGFIQRLAGILTEKEVPKDIKTYDQAMLPPIDIEKGSAPVDFPLNYQAQGQTSQATGSGLQTQAVGSPDSSQDVVARTANYYEVSENVSLPDIDSSTRLTFWERIQDWLGLLQTGNESAENLLSTQTPPGVAREVLSQKKTRMSLSYKSGSTDVLGFYTTAELSEYAMRDAVDAARCANLPYGMGDCLNSGLLYPPDTPTPTPSPTPVTLPGASPTPSSDDFPVSKNGDLYCANQLPVSSTLVNIFRNSGNWKSMPGVILASIGCIEWSAMWGYSESSVQSYSKEGGKVPNCHPNACAAMGPMQITVGIDDKGSTTCSGCGLTKCGDSWSKYGNAAIAALGRSTTSACNITDSVYAAAKKVDAARIDKAGYAAAGNTYSHYCAAATDDWTDPNLISCVAGAYYGECRPCVKDSATGKYNTYACNRFYNAFGQAMNYCQFAVRFYNQWKAQY